MNSSKEYIDQIELEGLLEKHPISISVSQVRKGVPRINFKKIKLTKCQNLDNLLRLKNITKIFLNDNLIKLDLPIKRVTSEKTYETNFVNPLRKKIDYEEKPIDVSNIETSITTNENINSEEEVSQPVSDVSPESSDESENYSNLIDDDEELVDRADEKDKDITFNLEAQINHEDENIIFSPATVSLPPLKGDILSTSGEQPAFVWPPIAAQGDKIEKQNEPDKPSSSKLKKTKKKNKKRSKKKKSPYYLTNQEKDKKNIIPDKVKPTGFKQISLESKQFFEKVEAEATFPWTLSSQNYEGHESIYSGGLESELIESPAEKPQSQNLPFAETGKITKPAVSPPELISKEKDVELLYEKQTGKEPSYKTLILKALPLKFSLDLLQEVVIDPDLKDIKTNTFLNRDNKVHFGVEFLGRVEKMFERFGSARITPFRIIIIGGVTATVGYLLWNQFLPDTNVNSFYKKKQDKDTVLVRDLFKNKHVLKKDLILKSQDKSTQGTLGDLNEKLITPITEQERYTLIEKARESLENRADPFGQESVLPPLSPEEVKAKLEEKSPPDISLQRKQVELVGIISAKGKNLALVNVYTADYTVGVSDDKAAREMKLKTSLSMAVPNRLEVSILDPVEEWNVKAIIKSKARNEEPTIELVKGDKKFKLRVGQKVLLPEDKPISNLSEPDEDEKNDLMSDNSDVKADSASPSED
ncbi:MAG: hypothetical protein HY094_02200 [Candidatus Melainabacteria bacterium]|nr:hypothetical protein [Candidatus Melainabacteria bacterium]